MNSTAAPETRATEARGASNGDDQAQDELRAQSAHLETDLGSALIAITPIACSRPRRRTKCKPVIVLCVRRAADEAWSFRACWRHNSKGSTQNAAIRI